MSKEAIVEVLERNLQHKINEAYGKRYKVKHDKYMYRIGVFEDGKEIMYYHLNYSMSRSGKCFYLTEKRMDIENNKLRKELNEIFFLEMLNVVDDEINDEEIFYFNCIDDSENREMLKKRGYEVLTQNEEEKTIRAIKWTDKNKVKIVELVRFLKEIDKYLVQNSNLFKIMYDFSELPLRDNDKVFVEVVHKGVIFRLDIKNLNDGFELELLRGPERVFGVQNTYDIEDCSEFFNQKIEEYLKKIELEFMINVPISEVKSYLVRAFPMLEIEMQGLTNEQYLKIYEALNEKIEGWSTYKVIEYLELASKEKRNIRVSLVKNEIIEVRSSEKFSWGNRHKTNILSFYFENENVAFVEINLEK